jgi:hypothetical protein
MAQKHELKIVGKKVKLYFPRPNHSKYRIAENRGKNIEIGNIEIQFMQVKI